MCGRCFSSVSGYIQCSDHPVHHLGVAAGVMFYYPDMTHTLIGIFLLMWANHYDSCDGQLARMTGKKTRWGRMLDGFAGDLWFITIYVAICLRLMTQPLPFHLGEGFRTDLEHIYMADSLVLRYGVP